MQHYKQRQAEIDKKNQAKAKQHSAISKLFAYFILWSS